MIPGVRTEGTTEIEKRVGLWVSLQVGADTTRTHVSFPESRLSVNGDGTPVATNLVTEPPPLSYVARFATAGLDRGTPKVSD